MGATGGSIESVTLRGRTYGVAADGDSQRSLGGSVNEYESNGDQVTGRLLKTATPWEASDLALSIDDLNGDAVFLQDLADSNDLFAITVAYASGAIFEGTGQISGVIQVSSTNTTATLGLKGSGN